MKSFLQMLFLAVFLFNSSIASASPVSVVTSNDCKKLAGTDRPFMLVLKKGESLTKAIVLCVKDAGFPSVSFYGLGALMNPSLRYFSYTAKRYETKNFLGMFEIDSLDGDVTQLEGKPFVHAHVTLSDSTYRVIGGHLGEGVVGLTAEITVIPFQNKIERKMEEGLEASLIYP